MICTQCHSRPQGTIANDQPVNKDNRMLTPGISRNEYLVNHTTREDAAQKDFWPDGVHSKSHHQQGTDLIRSKHYANETQTLSCSNCHDPHGTDGPEAPDAAGQCATARTRCAPAATRST